MARIGQVITKEELSSMRQVTENHLASVRQGSQRMIKLRYLFEQPAMTGEQAIEAQSIIKSMTESDYFKRRQSVRLEIQQWQRRLAELLPLG